MTLNLGYKLSFISIALFLAYGAVVLTGILPFSLFDAGWQLRFCLVLVENAALPLIGVGILHLAIHLDGASLSLRQRHAFVSQWAMIAAVGFFLLVPLQVASAWSFQTSNIQVQNGAEQSVINRKFEGMRRAINSATSPADLQARLNAAGGPSLSAANLATPFPVLRSKLLASLEQAQRNALDQLSRSKPSMIWSLLQRCLRVILSAVGYGLGFAASAQRPDSELTVLQKWTRARKIGKRHENSHGNSNQRKGVLARLEEWQARRAYKRKLQTSRSSSKIASNLDNKAYKKEIPQEEKQSKDP